MPSMSQFNKAFSRLEENPDDLRSQGVALVLIKVLFVGDTFVATATALVYELARLTGQNPEALLRVIGR